jgi:hypothetical protein
MVNNRFICFLNTAISLSVHISIKNIYFYVERNKTLKFTMQIYIILPHSTMHIIV